MKIIIISIMMVLMTTGCSTTQYSKTVPKVDIDRFMKKWYVIAGRLTFLEKGAHNAVEVYTWNKEESRIDIDFTFLKDSFSGKVKSVPQKAWIHNSKDNAHWKVSPFWPVKFNYLIIDLADDYSWTVIGVPGQEWVWIMAQDWKMSDETLAMIVKRIEASGYNVSKIKRVPQMWKD
ncbi:MAG: lipocalin family protein [Bacteriovoracaceae bacterium]|nr:lipocalin family protein [Bacteriovoracaceae bacterium]